MVFEVMSILVYYATNVVKGLYDIVTGTEELIYDKHGKVIAKLPSKRKQMLIFIKNFLKEPAMIGAAFPCTQFVTDKILAPIDFDTARFIVEYGPGVGNMSMEVLRRMRSDAKLLVLELNEDLVEFLKTEYHDHRFIACGRSAADVEAVLREYKFGRPDYIISSIPFSNMPSSIAERIAHATKTVLKPDGKFLIWQYRSTVLDFIRPYFKHIDYDYEVVNAPPVRLYYAYN